MVRIVFLSLCVSIMVFMSGCANPQDIGILDSRISVLEQDNVQHLDKEKQYEIKLDKIAGTYEKKLIQNDKASKERYAELKADINILKEKIRLLSGRIEEVEHNFSQNGKLSAGEREKNLQRLDNAVSQNFQRIVQLEQYMGFEPSEAVKNGNKAESKTRTVVKSEQGLYQQAKQFLDMGQTDQARSKFEEFIKLYPGSVNADNARFWIADSYYRDKWYEKAILEYQKVIEKYPKGNKVAAALLKQGFAFSNLGEKANARLLLKELIKKYPSSREAKIAKDKLKVLK